MTRTQLAVGMNHRRVNGNFRWVRVKAAPRSRPDTARDPQSRARAIILAVPLSVLLWVGLFIALR